MNNHEIEYTLHGDDMQFVRVELDPQETVMAEVGAMMMMDGHVQMTTVFGDGSQTGGGLFGRLKGAGKRMLTGESLFMTAFTNAGAGKQTVSFAAATPGKIIPMDLSEMGGKVICQKDAFLAAAKGVSIGIAFQRKLGTGFFGGEGFIMQKLEGDGIAFVHAGGTVHEVTLDAGQELKVDTGCLVAMTQDIQYDIEFVKGVKNKLFGGEGFFYARLRGPGTVWVQSMPFSRLAEKVYSAAPQNPNSIQKGEGSMAGGLFKMIGGE